MVERNLAKVEVASSRLVSRSRCIGRRSFSGTSGRIRRREASASLFRQNVPNQRRGSKAVMQRIANPSRWVRLPPAPPAYVDPLDSQNSPPVRAVLLCTAVRIEPRAGSRRVPSSSARRLSARSAPAGSSCSRVVPQAHVTASRNDLVAWVDGFGASLTCSPGAFACNARTERASVRSDAPDAPGRGGVVRAGLRRR